MCRNWILTFDLLSIVLSWRYQRTECALCCIVKLLIGSVVITHYHGWKCFSCNQIYAGFSHRVELSWFRNSMVPSQHVFSGSRNLLIYTAEVMSVCHVDCSTATAVRTPGVHKDHSSFSQEFVGNFSSQHCVRSIQVW
jgi:hypothetical protein